MAYKFNKTMREKYNDLMEELNRTRIVPFERLTYKPTEEKIVVHRSPDEIKAFITSQETRLTSIYAI